MGKRIEPNDNYWNGNHKNAKLINMLAAMVEITALVPISYPIDLVKSRLQTNYYSSYTMFFKSLKDMEHNKTLYRGFVPLYIGLMIKQPMKMVAFETFANKPESDQPIKIFGFTLSNSVKSSLSATCAGFFVGIPLSFIKTNYQVDNKFKLNFQTLKTTNIFNAWKYEFFKEGIGNMAYFYLYEKMRATNNIFSPEHKGINNFINGSVSGITATFLAYPVDLMKSRKQTISRNDTLRQIFISVGYQNKNAFNPMHFWKGAMPIYFRVSIFGGIGMYVYEKVREYISKAF